MQAESTEFGAQGATDPGWGKAVRRAWLPPQFGAPPRAGLGDPGEPSVVRHRTMLCSFGLYILLASVAVLVVVPLTSDQSLQPALAGVVATGLAALLGQVAIGRRIFVPDQEPGEVAASRLEWDYQSTFFVQLALAGLPALVGFVAAFSVRSAVPYLLGALLSVVALVAIAPTQARLGKLDRRLTAAGRSASLSAALLRVDVERPGQTG